MTLQNVDEFILFVLKKHSIALMRPAIARHIRKEFNRDVNTSILKARLKNFKRKGIISSFRTSFISGSYYQIKSSKT